MIKNQKGITIVALVVTIIVMVILTWISLGTGYSVVKDIRIGRIISNMALVKAKAETVYEQYQFSGKEEDLVGKEVILDFVTEKEIEIIEQKAGNYDFENWKWYEWSPETLIKQGLDASLLKEGQYFYVNYQYGEIIINTGTSYNLSDTKFFSLTGLSYLYENS